MSGAHRIVVSLIQAGMIGWACYALWNGGSYWWLLFMVIAFTVSEREQ